MPFTDRANTARAMFTAAGRRLAVSGFTVRERLSLPFDAEIGLAAEEEIDFEELLGKPGLLTVTGDKVERHFHGLVRTFRQTGASGRFFLYQARIVPALWLLSLERDCRIFQDRTTEEIVRQVLAESGILADRFEFRLKTRTLPRPYCVQYRETDLDFISRLLEEEGIFYFFEHSPEGHRLVFGDAAVATRPIPAEPTLLFNPTAAMVAEEEGVIELAAARRMQPGRAALKDFDFEKPSLPLLCDAAARQDGRREVFDFPGGYREDGAGRRAARVRLEQERFLMEGVEGRSTCVRLAPGFSFRLESHDAAALNREYLVIETEHTGAQPQVLAEQATGAGTSYACRFSAIPADVPPRPQRRTPRPVVKGVQTAIVTGPSGEEIYTDAHGRVKVHFHWDRRGVADEKSSCWIRVSHAWAGAGWGASYPPRIGQEVVVDFLEGDPDRPIIIGRVYHGENRPPCELPSGKTKSTLKSDSTPGGGGANELRFEDAKGAEELYLHGQRDWTIAVENDKRQTIGRDETLAVGENRSKSVGADQSETVGANKTVKVGAEHVEIIGANMALKVGASKTETVAGATHASVGASKALTIGAAYQITVGGAMKETVDGPRAEEVGLGRALWVGRDLFKTVEGKMTVKVGLDLKESVGEVHTLQAKTVRIDADTEVVLKAGKARITLKQNGDLRIDGAEIGVKGSGNLTLKGAKILKTTGAAPAAAAAAPSAPAPGSEPPKPIRSGLGNDTDELIEKSPTLKEQLRKFQENGGRIQFGDAGSGSAYNATRKTITIDRNLRNDPNEMVQTLSHELGHAHSDVPKDFTSKDKFLKSYLDDEGEATLSNLTVRQEILDNGGPDIGVAGSQVEDYKKIFKQFQKDGDRNSAREAIGKIFGDKEIPSTSAANESYSEYYGRWYDTWQKSLSP
jgi:type VI secretion system secreted protein VgrG